MQPFVPRRLLARAIGCHTGECFNTLTHLLALALSLAGGVALVAQAVERGGASRITGACVFALSMTTMYAASVLYHRTHSAEKKAFWERADHASIYLLIGGTYSPFALLAAPGSWQWLVGLALWILAITGVVRAMRADSSTPPPLGLYLLMGWLAVLGAAPVAAVLSNAALAWLLAGAAWYSAGTVFYRNRRGHAHAHGIWHLFVLAGTASHYQAIKLGLA